MPNSVFRIVGIGFQIVEDVLYAHSEANIVTALIRALTPFHFTFGLLRQGKGNGKKGYYVLAFVVPFLVHGLYDFMQDLISVTDFCCPYSCSS